MLAVLPLDAARGQQGPVAHLLDRDAAVLDRVDPPFHHNPPGVCEGVQFPAHPDKHFIAVIRPALQQAGELVRIEPSADSHVPDGRAVERRDIAQQAVPRRDAEDVVDQLEVFDVGTDDIVLQRRVLPEDLPDPLVEKFLAAQAGQPVILELVDHGGGFTQADDAGRAVQDDLRLIGLGHKIRRAVGEGRHLVGLAVALRGDDDRDGRIVGMLLDDRKEGVAVHDGHDDVQQDQSDLLPMPL